VLILQDDNSHPRITLEIILKNHYYCGDSAATATWFGFDFGNKLFPLLFLFIQTNSALKRYCVEQDSMKKVCKFKALNKDLFIGIKKLVQ